MKTLSSTKIALAAQAQRGKAKRDGASAKRNTVLAMISQRPMTVAQIASASGFYPQLVREALNRLLDRAQAFKSPDFSDALWSNKPFDSVAASRESAVLLHPLPSAATEIPEVNPHTGRTPKELKYWELRNAMGIPSPVDIGIYKGPAARGESVCSDRRTE